MTSTETNVNVEYFWKRLYIDHAHDYSQNQVRYVIIQSKGECKHIDELTPHMIGYHS